MNFFAKGVLPIPVDLQDDNGSNVGVTYQARALQVRASSGAYRYSYGDVVDYIRTRYDYNLEIDDFEVAKLSREKQLELSVVLNTPKGLHKLALVQAACGNGWELEETFNYFLGEFDFFEKCYETALQLNPDLAPKDVELPTQADSKELAETKN